MRYLGPVEARRRDPHHLDPAVRAAESRAVTAAVALPGPLVNRAGEPERDWRTCTHPDDRIEWRRDRLMYRWVGVCGACRIGRTFANVTPPIVRTDEQLANGDVPPIPDYDRHVADTMPSLDYQPW